MLRTEQWEHLDRIKVGFCREVEQKYKKGAKEHNSLLTDEPVDNLLRFAIEEALDQVTYLMTMREKLEKESKVLGKNQGVLTEVVEEMKRAEAKHGVMTSDYFRAMAILGEEYGEATKAALELGRLDRACNVNTDEWAGKRGGAVSNLRNELIQVAAVAIHIINTLR